MYVFWAIVLLFNAFILSSLSGYMSVMGMAALFPAGGVTVISMMSALEVGKLVIAAFIHATLHNPKLGNGIRTYLIAATVMLMAITCLGVFGNLSKYHQEGAAPIAGIQIKIDQSTSRIKQLQDDQARLNTRRAQLDDQVGTLLKNSKSAKDAASAQKLQTAQKKERDQIKAASDKDDAEINALNDTLAPLKLQLSDVNGHLGPVQAVADAVGWTDPNTAVRVIASRPSS